MYFDIFSIALPYRLFHFARSFFFSVFVSISFCFQKDILIFVLYNNFSPVILKTNKLYIFNLLSISYFILTTEKTIKNLLDCNAKFQYILTL